MLRDDQEGHDGLPFGSHSMASTPNQQINPYYHPMAFHTLREYIIRFDSGYVHPDLGFLVPAPSGKLLLYFIFVLFGLWLCLILFVKLVSNRCRKGYWYG